MIKMMLLFFILTVRIFGYFVNPITDVSWKCLFPIHVAGFNLTPNHNDPRNYTERYCYCGGIGTGGLPIAFWEPTHLVDISRAPFKLLAFGGIELAPKSYRRGTLGGGSYGKHAFYHVHYYEFPLLSLWRKTTDFICAETFSLDIVYMSEFDPFWNDSKWTTILNPEALLFANPLAALACAADCVSASFGHPLEKLFWCAGCQGSLYPLVGHVAHPIGIMQTSSLLIHRILTKLNTLKVLTTFKEKDFCHKTRSWLLRKKAYKTQLLFPKAQTKAPCNTLGKSTALWGAGRSYPGKGEDAVYLIWTKKQCCLDPVHIAAKIAAVVASGGATTAAHQVGSDFSTLIDTNTQVRGP